MSKAPQTPNRRLRVDSDAPPTKKRARRSWRKIGARILTTLIVLAGVALLAVSGAFWYYGRDLPPVTRLRDFHPRQTTRVLDRRGEVLAEIFEERRTVVAFDRIPRALIVSTLAAEDADFYRHEGLDYPGMLRAIARAVIRGSRPRGTSTITQQLVKLLLLTPEQTPERKIREIILAHRIEQTYTKDEILGLYLNTINYGHGRYGVEEASRFYFGRGVETLSLAEASLLAGLPQAPTHLSPRAHPEAARQRQRFVLAQLEDKRAQYWPDITSQQIADAREEPLRLTPPPERGQDAPELLAIVRELLENLVGESGLAEGGYEIRTTIDRDIQRAARAALDAGLEQYEARHPPRRPRGGERERAQPDPERAPTPDGAVIVIDPRSRDVLALVGGREADAGFNRATQARRQPGSAFKPIVYATAIRTRRYTAASAVLDSPETFANWRPRNFETWESIGPVRLREAIANSVNLVAIRVMHDVGPRTVVDLGRALGITTPMQPTLALALGASEVRPIELTNAYASFAAGGVWAPTRLVSSVRNSAGLALPIASGEPPRRVLEPAEAFIVTSLLTSVVRTGTATDAMALGRPAAGKTGTSNDARDVWFIGYTPDLVVGVWVGFDDHRPLGRRETGGRTALPIWLATMRAALGERPPVEFPEPAGLVHAAIDPVSGLLAYDGMAEAIDEIFLPGTVPTDVATPVVDAGVADAALD